jgi:hypothetical protein
VERAVAGQNPEDIQRWTTRRKAALVLSILKGETSIQEAARQARHHRSRAGGLEGVVPAGRKERSSIVSQE